MEQIVDNIMLVNSKDEIEYEEAGTFFLEQISWNDYGWSTNYSLYYQSADNLIGRIKVVKIVDEEINEDLLALSEYQGLIDNFFMIGDSPEVYKNLIDLMELEEAKDFLKTMGDLALTPTLYDDLLSFKDKGKSLLSNSFFRYPRTRIMFSFYRLFRKNEHDQKWIDLTLEELAKQLTPDLLGEIGNLLEDVDGQFEELNDNLKAEWDDGEKELKNVVINIIGAILKNSSKFDIKKYEKNDIFSLTDGMLMDLMDYSEKNEIRIEKEAKDFVDKLETIEVFNQNNELVTLFNNLKKGSTLINDIRNILTLNWSEIENVEERKLGQYTSAENLKYLINKEHEIDANNNPGMSTLRLTNSNQLNDPKEGKIFWEILDKMSKKEEGEVPGSSQEDYEASDIFLSSTTAAIDILPMWKQYANDGKGLFLKYSSDYIKKLCNSGLVQVRRVCYLDWKDTGDFNLKLASFPGEDVREKEADLKEKFQSLKELSNLASIKDIIYSFKRMEYSYENEFRIFINLENIEDRDERVFFDEKPGYPVPFVYTTIKNKDVEKNKEGVIEQDNENLPVNYDEVIVGPIAKDIDYIAPYIKECDRKIKVVKSKIQYR
ncbi:DUF2971 domain-containing protein [Lactobacillus sp. PV037]|uniref:DUF2971 domain-containing protein n=1 Tax=unclassified Lactobacillus TaxID=2620435 RepID=UPI00223ECA40|nr:MULTISPECIES: DUF2971 domain-containing protein [unclassified Lactobacillus]QNQ82387.1 DUF2971 domain-containing protein [Lactobacillus sp. PV012]QNQ83499.1 DUF2971 domain-containing protein [Lactobacillus sp. PV037]